MKKGMYTAVTAIFDQFTNVNLVYMYWSSQALHLLTKFTSGLWGRLLCHLFFIVLFPFVFQDCAQGPMSTKKHAPHSLEETVMSPKVAPGMFINNIYCYILYITKYVSLQHLEIWSSLYLLILYHRLQEKLFTVSMPPGHSSL